MRCPVCEQTTEHYQLRVYHSARGVLEWQPREHRAPCGAWCSGGGTASDEPDVHTPAGGPCPRCGATRWEVDIVLTRSNGLERVVIYRYTVERLRRLGFYMAREVRNGDEWTVADRMLGDHRSLQDTMALTARYWPWVLTEVTGEPNGGASDDAASNGSEP